VVRVITSLPNKTLPLNKCHFIKQGGFEFPTHPIDNHSFLKLSLGAVAHSERRLFTGFANAALTAWKLMVINAIIMAASPPAANNHQLILMR
jgi:hypothetical protein